MNDPTGPKAVGFRPPDRQAAFWSTPFSTPLLSRSSASAFPRASSLTMSFIVKNKHSIGNLHKTAMSQNESIYDVVPSSPLRAHISRSCTVSQRVYTKEFARVFICIEVINRVRKKSVRSTLEETATHKDTDSATDVRPRVLSTRALCVRRNERRVHLHRRNVRCQGVRLHQRHGMRR